MPIVNTCMHGKYGPTTFIGASLSEPHIDELHVRNLYIYIL